MSEISYQPFLESKLNNIKIILCSNMSRLHSQPQQLSCPICYQSFQPSTNPSVIVCSNKHSICARCVGHLQSFKCPFCRGTINFGQANPPNQSIVNQPSTIQRQQAVNFFQDHCWRRLADSFFYICSNKSWIFLTGIHSVLLIFDIIILVSDNEPTCVDNSYNLLLTIRQFSFLKEIWGLFSITYFLVLIMLKQFCVYYFRFQNALIGCFFIQLSGKIIFWAVIQPTVFFTVVKDHCTEGIYVYYLIQVILHTFIIPIFVVFNKKLTR